MWDNACMTYQAVTDFPGLSVRLEANPDGRMVITGLTLEASAVTAEMLRKIPMSRIENQANAIGEPVTDLPPLRRDEGVSAEAFSQLVADHYRAWAGTHANPAAGMAAKWDIKPPTMHSWIREARLRGLLPPARRRKG